MTGGDRGSTGRSWRSYRNGNTQGRSYSQDPFLSGNVAAAEAVGIAETGPYPFAEHLARNDRENRCGDTEPEWGTATWVNGQSIGEPYLKLYSILDNALVNVTEAIASLSIDKRKISVGIAKQGKYVRVEISDCFVPSVAETNGTSKADKQRHGYGLQACVTFRKV